MKTNNRSNAVFNQISIKNQICKNLAQTNQLLPPVPQLRGALNQLPFQQKQPVHVQQNRINIQNMELIQRGPSNAKNNREGYVVSSAASTQRRAQSVIRNSDDWGNILQAEGQRIAPTLLVPVKKPAVQYGQTMRARSQGRKLRNITNTVAIGQSVDDPINAAEVRSKDMMSSTDQNTVIEGDHGAMSPQMDYQSKIMRPGYSPNKKPQVAGPINSDLEHIQIKASQLRMPPDYMEPIPTRNIEIPEPSQEKPRRKRKQVQNNETLFLADIAEKNTTARRKSPEYRQNSNLSSKEIKEEMTQLLTQYETYATVKVKSKNPDFENKDSREREQNIYTQTQNSLNNSRQNSGDVREQELKKHSVISSKITINMHIPDRSRANNSTRRTIDVSKKSSKMYTTNNYYQPSDLSFLPQNTNRNVSVRPAYKRDLPSVQLKGKNTKLLSKLIQVHKIENTSRAKTVVKTQPSKNKAMKIGEHITGFEGLQSTRESQRGRIDKRQSQMEFNNFRQEISQNEKTLLPQQSSFTEDTPIVDQRESRMISDIVQDSGVEKLKVLQNILAQSRMRDINKKASVIRKNIQEEYKVPNLLGQMKGFTQKVSIGKISPRQHSTNLSNNSPRGEVSNQSDSQSPRNGKSKPIITIDQSVNVIPGLEAKTIPIEPQQPQAENSQPHLKYGNFPFQNKKVSRLELEGILADQNVYSHEQQIPLIPSRPESQDQQSRYQEYHQQQMITDDSPSKTYTVNQNSDYHKERGVETAEIGHRIANKNLSNAPLQQQNTHRSTKNEENTDVNHANEILDNYMSSQIKQTKGKIQEANDELLDTKEQLEIVQNFLKSQQKDRAHLREYSAFLTQNCSTKGNVYKSKVKRDSKYYREKLDIRDQMIKESKRSSTQQQNMRKPNGQFNQERNYHTSKFDDPMLGWESKQKNDQKEAAEDSNAISPNFGSREEDGIKQDIFFQDERMTQFISPAQSVDDQTIIPLQQNPFTIDISKVKQHMNNEMTSYGTGAHTRNVTTHEGQRNYRDSIQGSSKGHLGTASINVSDNINTPVETFIVTPRDITPMAFPHWPQYKTARSPQPVKQDSQRTPGPKVRFDHKKLENSAFGRHKSTNGQESSSVIGGFNGPFGAEKFMLVQGPNKQVPFNYNYTYDMEIIKQQRLQNAQKHNLNRATHVAIRKMHENMQERLEMKVKREKTNIISKIGETLNQKMAIKPPPEIDHNEGGFDQRNYMTEDGEFDFMQYLVEQRQIAKRPKPAKSTEEQHQEVKLLCELLDRNREITRKQKELSSRSKYDITKFKIGKPQPIKILDLWVQDNQFTDNEAEKSLLIYILSSIYRTKAKKSNQDQNKLKAIEAVEELRAQDQIFSDQISDVEMQETIEQIGYILDSVNDSDISSIHDHKFEELNEEEINLQVKQIQERMKRQLKKSMSNIFPKKKFDLLQQLSELQNVTNLKDKERLKNKILSMLNDVGGEEKADERDIISAESALHKFKRKMMRTMTANQLKQIKKNHITVDIIFVATMFATRQLMRQVFDMDIIPKKNRDFSLDSGEDVDNDPNDECCVGYAADEMATTKGSMYKNTNLEQMSRYLGVSKHRFIYDFNLRINKKQPKHEFGSPSDTHRSSFKKQEKAKEEWQLSQKFNQLGMLDFKIRQTIDKKLHDLSFYKEAKEGNFKSKDTANSFIMKEFYQNRLKNRTNPERSPIHIQDLPQKNQLDADADDLTLNVSQEIILDNIDVKENKSGRGSAMSSMQTSSPQKPKPTGRDSQLNLRGTSPSKMSNKLDSPKKEIKEVEPEFHSPNYFSGQKLHLNETNNQITLFELDSNIEYLKKRVQNEFITQFVIDGWKASDTMISKIIKYMKQFQIDSLKSIVIRNVKLGFQSIQALVGIVSRCYKIQLENIQFELNMPFDGTRDKCKRKYDPDDDDLNDEGHHICPMYKQPLKAEDGQEPDTKRDTKMIKKEQAMDFILSHLSKPYTEQDSANQCLSVHQALNVRKSQSVGSTMSTTSKPNLMHLNLSNFKLNPDALCDLITFSHSTIQSFQISWCGLTVKQLTQVIKHYNEEVKESQIPSPLRKLDISYNMQSNTSMFKGVPMYNCGEWGPNQEKFSRISDDYKEHAAAVKEFVDQLLRLLKDPDLSPYITYLDISGLQALTSLGQLSKNLIEDICLVLAGGQQGLKGEEGQVRYCQNLMAVNLTDLQITEDEELHQDILEIFKANENEGEDDPFLKAFDKLKKPSPKVETFDIANLIQQAVDLYPLRPDQKNSKEAAHKVIYKNTFIRKTLLKDLNRNNLRKPERGRGFDNFIVSRQLNRPELIWNQNPENDKNQRYRYFQKDFGQNWYSSGNAHMANDCFMDKNSRYTLIFYDQGQKNSNDDLIQLYDKALLDHLQKEYKKTVQKPLHKHIEGPMIYGTVVTPEKQKGTVNLNRINNLSFKRHLRMLRADMYTLLSICQTSEFFQSQDDSDLVKNSIIQYLKTEYDDRVNKMRIFSKLRGWNRMLHQMCNENKVFDILSINQPGFVQQSQCKHWAKQDATQYNVYVYAAYLDPGYHQFLIYDPANHKAYCKDILIEKSNQEVYYPELPKKIAAVQPRVKHKNVFQKWNVETIDRQIKAYNYDTLPQKNSKGRMIDNFEPERFLKNPKDIELCEKILQANFMVLQVNFIEALCISENYPQIDYQSLEDQFFKVHDYHKKIGNKINECTQTEIELCFIRGTKNDKVRGLKGNLCRGEYVDTIFRLAHGWSVENLKKSGTYQRESYMLSDQFQEFINTFMIPIFEGSRLLKDREIIHNGRLVNRLLYMNQQTLKKLYQEFKIFPPNPKYMTFETICRLLEIPVPIQGRRRNAAPVDQSLEGETIYYPIDAQAIRHAFVFSQQIVTNEQKYAQSYFSISYLEFLDCLNRLAITLHQKPEKEHVHALIEDPTNNSQEKTNDDGENPPLNNEQENLEWERKSQLPQEEKMFNLLTLIYERKYALADEIIQRHEKTKNKAELDERELDGLWTPQTMPLLSYKD